MTFELMKGIVEDNNSPLKNGSVRVRIFGMHSFQKGFEEIKTEHLPWIEVIGDFVSEGVGVSKIPEIGTIVHVLVTENLDLMLVLGTVKSQLEFNDVQKGMGKTLLQPGSFGGITEPSELDSKTKYPNSLSLKTKSGHFIIVDDTSGNERIKLQHKTGQFFEFRPDGNFVLRSNSSEKNFTIIEGSLDQYFEKQVKQKFGDILNIDQEGNINIKSGQGINIEAEDSVIVKGSTIELN